MTDNMKITITERSPQLIFTQWLFLGILLILNSGLSAQEADNEFTLDAKFKTRAELRYGGFDPNSDENIAHFINGQYQLNIGYKRSWLELKLSPRFAGIWGGSSASISLAEGWALMRTKHGFFAKIGRQDLEYDDERILGYDDWSMTASTHDVLKFGYEGFGHKVHVLLAYNQDADNVSTGGTYYSGGIQPYKTMQTIWYHYETPKSFFGISLLAMNIGMQDAFQQSKITFYQQLYGGYMTLRPKYCLFEGAFYYQLGDEEHGIPMDAYMGSFKFHFSTNDMYSIYGGYDYLSGDKYFAVPPSGMIGLVRHDKVRGFSSLFGSHHDFYGAMDFFYMDSYVNNFTPGLQNVYMGAYVKPVKGLKIDAAYHFFAIATDLAKFKKPLGHEVELSVEYSFAEFVTLSSGYSFMVGTETMEHLQSVSSKRHLHWGWLMLTVNPTIFTKAWADKKKKRDNAVTTE
jgi:hypothetical protein